MNEQDFIPGVFGGRGEERKGSFRVGKGLWSTNTCQTYRVPPKFPFHQRRHPDPDPDPDANGPATIHAMLAMLRSPSTHPNEGHETVQDVLKFYEL
ncbi:hypothetical protein FOPE_07115 [Fonsecaea pedrosoi]|nr:hypothetical protein FOPE_07115 [Fonsecaea pedrosoi]